MWKLKNIIRLLTVRLVKIFLNREVWEYKVQKTCGGKKIFFENENL